MSVISFTEHKHRETIALLRYVLRLAVQGKIAGMALCFRTQNEDEYAFTGEFKTDSALALKAANRISWKMNQAVDAMESRL